MKIMLRLILIFVFILSLSGLSYATNGMNMISYGGQEAGMAGASLSVSNNPVAMNNNPAGLTAIHNADLILGLSLLMRQILSIGILSRRLVRITRKVRIKFSHYRF